MDTNTSEQHDSFNQTGVANGNCPPASSGQISLGRFMSDKGIQREHTFKPVSLNSTEHDESRSETDNDSQSPTAGKRRSSPNKISATRANSDGGKTTSLKRMLTVTSDIGHIAVERSATAVKLVKNIAIKIKPDSEELYPWINVVVIAVVVGCIEYLPAALLAWSVPAKYDFLDWMITRHGLVMMMLANVALSMSLVVGSVLLTRTVPCAAGSGIPNLIAYLYSGKLTDDKLLSPQMVFVKMVGVTMAISGGLPIGREGPAIHIGAGVGDFTNRMINKFIEFRTGVPVPFDGVIKSNVVMMGITAGFACAFRAPIGGMLYCIEEIATHWDIKSHMTVGAQTFMVAAVSSFVTDLIVRLTQDSGSVHFSSIIIFNGDDVELYEGAVYHNYDFPGFLVIALLCGIMSGVTTRVSNYIRAWRFADPARQKLWRVVFDAAIVAGVTAVIFSMETLIYRHCKHVPEEDDGHRRLSGGGGDREFVQYNCDDRDYSELASLSLTGEESVIRHLLSRDEEEFDLVPLVIFFCMYLPLSLIARSLPLPMGSFVPNLLVGSLLGRIIGEICELVYPDHLISEPGVYALIGAAAMLGGWTRTMIAVVVLLVEITGDVGMTIPLIGAVVISRGISMQIAHHSFSHEYFYQLVDDPANGNLAVLHPNDWEPFERKRRMTLQDLQPPVNFDAEGDDSAITQVNSQKYDFTGGVSAESASALEMTPVEGGIANLSY